MVILLHLVSLISSIFLFSKGGTACDLVPGNAAGSCLELKATPYINSTTSNYGPDIEGTSVNPRGDIFAVNYGDATLQNKLGQVFPIQKQIYVDEVPTSWLNGIRFWNQFVAYTVDAVNHRVLKLELKIGQTDSVVTGSSVFCSDPRFLQPNDLTLSISSGTVITSGMRMLNETNNTHGDIWACLQNGQVKQLEVMGRTNGIDLSPDEKTLYVSESYNKGGVAVTIAQKIWKYNINVKEGSISGKTLFADFATVDGSVDVDIDGMKTDSKGNLYVTRHRGASVMVFSPTGAVIGKIGLSFPNPTNLDFGGPSGTTLFIVGKCGDNENKGCIDKIEVSNPGRTWSLLQDQSCVPPGSGSGSDTSLKHLVVVAAVAVTILHQNTLWYK